MILYVLLALKSKQEDFTDEFLRADVEDDENIFVEMPKGFQKIGKVLKLGVIYILFNKVLLPFGKNLTHKFNNYDLVQSKFNLCFFMRDMFICTVSIDEILFWERNMNGICELSLELLEDVADIEQYYDADGFLGLKTLRSYEHSLIEMQQNRLIE